mgnify:CR=1 FL=1
MSDARAARRRSVVDALAVLQKAGFATHMEEADRGLNAAPAFWDRSKPIVGSPPEAKQQRKHHTTEAWLRAVRECVLLDGLPPAELNYVLASARPIQTREGEALFEQGDSVTSGMIYLVASGKYRALIDDGFNPKVAPPPRPPPAAHTQVTLVSSA